MNPIKQCQQLDKTIQKEFRAKSTKLKIRKKKLFAKKFLQSYTPYLDSQSVINNI